MYMRRNIKAQVSNVETFLMLPHIYVYIYKQINNKRKKEKQVNI